MTGIGTPVAAGSRAVMLAAVGPAGLMSAVLVRSVTVRTGEERDLADLAVAAAGVSSASIADRLGCPRPLGAGGPLGRAIGIEGRTPGRAGSLGTLRARGCRP